jgi:hypothetical protein
MFYVGRCNLGPCLSYSWCTELGTPCGNWGACSITSDGTLQGQQVVLRASIPPCARMLAASRARHDRACIDVAGGVPGGGMHAIHLSNLRSMLIMDTNGVATLIGEATRLQYCKMQLREVFCVDNMGARHPASSPQCAALRDTTPSAFRMCTGTINSLTRTPHHPALAVVRARMLADRTRATQVSARW